VRRPETIGPSIDALVRLWTILSGMLGYGMAGFIPNGFRLL